jgi:SAM-dependent methyltransferase
MVYYFLCDRCGFCFAPEFLSWTRAEFERRIYNEDYEEVDPDYVEARPQYVANTILGMLDAEALAIRHLDYGGGNGMLSDILFQRGWDSTSYDPFVNRDVAVGDLGTFDLITAVEVFEHVADVNRLASDLLTLLRPHGVVLFTTQLSDGKIARGQPLSWWYAAPRNGHISLFSCTSLVILANSRGLKFGSLSPNLHAFWRTAPSWAKGLVSDQ